MMITTKHFAVAAILAAGLASSPAVAAEGKEGKKGSGKGSGAAASAVPAPKPPLKSGASTPAVPTQRLLLKPGATTSAIPAPKLPSTSGALGSGIPENFRNHEELRGLGRLRDTMLNGDLDSQMGALGRLPSVSSGDAPKIGGRAVPGPSMSSRESEGQDGGSFNWRELGGPQAPSSRPGDVSRSNPGGATDAVPDGSDKASSGPYGSPSGSYRVTTRRAANGVTSTRTSMVLANGSRVSSIHTVGADGSTISNTNMTEQPDGSGNSTTTHSDGTTEVSAWNAKGETVKPKPPPDSQPAEGGNTTGGSDGCGWNPSAAGCTKSRVTEASILGKLAQPGPDDEVGNTSTGSGAPRIGPEAVTNPDGEHQSGRSGGGRPYDPRDDFGGGEGGPGPTE